MALAEACGVAAQSILTVGGVGGNVIFPSVINIWRLDQYYINLKFNKFMISG